MDHLPVEIVGKILSRLGGARDVLIAYATCRMWRQAFRNHLDTLSFNSADWPFYQHIPINHLEILISQTIFQTTGLGLQGLSIILMDNANNFSAASVILWLMYTRDTLTRLSYNVPTTPYVNIFDMCRRKNLEALLLGHNSIKSIFHHLKSLSLSDLRISVLDLNLLLNACPIIEYLELESLEFDAKNTIELSRRTLNSVYFIDTVLDKFILKADSIEYLDVKDSYIPFVELIRNGTLKHLMLDDLSVIHIDILDTPGGLQVVDVNQFTMDWPKFYQMISRSKNLRKLRLWMVAFDNDDEIINLESIAAAFKNLTHILLSYDLKNGDAYYSLQGKILLESVTVLELGWTMINNDVFSIWVDEVIRRCMNLKKLIIYASVSNIHTNGACQFLADFTRFIVQLMREFIDVEIQFDFE